MESSEDSFHIESSIKKFIDFLDAQELLDKTGGGIQVKDGQELAEKALYYLSHPHETESVGKAAKKAVMSNKGAADKHAAVIYRLLSQK